MSTVSEIRGHQHEYLYLIALFTGIRESEVLRLTWDCVDFKHCTLTVKQQLKKASKKSSCPNIRFHDMRHQKLLAASR